jgi:hypothetical protein
MKIIIAAVASLAFAGSVYASVPSTLVEKNAGAKAIDQMELAFGQNRSRDYSTKGSQNNQNKSVPEGGRSKYGG